MSRNGGTLGDDVTSFHRWWGGEPGGVLGGGLVHVDPGVWGLSCEWLGSTHGCKPVCWLRRWGNSSFRERSLKAGWMEDGVGRG